MLWSGELQEPHRCESWFVRWAECQTLFLFDDDSLAIHKQANTQQRPNCWTVLSWLSSSAHARNKPIFCTMEESTHTFVFAIVVAIVTPEISS